jgi:hypothetical protein
MSGFVWLKTIAGARTAGLFAFRDEDDNLYAYDGTKLDPPEGSIMLCGDELITAIKKSTSKGVYVCAWKETKDEWHNYLHETWNEHVHAYSVVDTAITTIASSAGMLSPHNRSKELLAELRARTMASKKQIQLQFEDGIKKSLQVLKPLTVRARRVALAAHLPT